MASKGRRDVELIIKARNEASKFIDAVSTSLDDLTKSQAEAGEGSKKTGDLLAQLGTELGKLTRTFTSASTASKRLEEAAKSTAAQQAKLIETIKREEASLEKLNAARDKAVRRQVSLKRRIDESRASQSAFNAELRKATTAANKDARAVQARQNAVDRQTARLDKLRSEYQKLQAVQSKDEGIARRREAEMNKIGAALVSQTIKQRENIAALQQAEAAARRSAAAQSALSAQSGAFVSRLERQRKAEAEVGAQLKVLDGQASATAGNLRKLQTQADQLGRSLSQQTGQLNRVSAEMSEVNKAAGEAASGLTRFSATARGGLKGSLVDAQRQLVKFKQEWREATQAISRSVAAGGSTASPTPQLAEQMRAAQQAKAAYLGMRDAIHQAQQAARKAAGDVNRLNEANRQSAESANKAGERTRYFANTLELLHKNSRKSMSWLQRIRSEVVALTVSYVGLFAAIQGAGEVIETVRVMQGAEQKLGVAFKGDVEAAGREVEWLHDQALELGASFQDLIHDYSSFAVAIEQSPKLAGKTRELFQPFVEAGTVLHASKDQMKLVFLALSQMVSKGVVSMEELRRQLGEQIPGAFELAAQAMDMETKEFSKFVAQGKLATDDFLPKFAALIQKTFGPQLPEAVKSLNSEIGRFRTHLFDMRRAVAGGGFLEGLNGALQTFNDFLGSDEGEQFFATLGAAAGSFLKIAAELVKHLDAITTIFKLWAARKATTFFVTMAADAGAFVRQARSVPAVMAAASASTRTNASVTTAAGAAWTSLGVKVKWTSLRLVVAARRLNAARVATTVFTGALGLLRGALAALGGVPGLIITGITFALTAWATKTDEATSALDRHRQILQKVREEYRKAAGDADKMAEKIKTATTGEILINDRELTKKIKELREKSLDRDPTRIWRVPVGDPMAKPLKSIHEAIEDFGKLNGSVDEFKERLSKIAEETSSPEMDSFLKDQFGIADEVKEATDALAENAAVLRLNRGEATKADRQLLGLPETLDRTTARTDDLSDALDKTVTSLQKFVPAAEAMAEKAKAHTQIDFLVNSFLTLHKEIDKTSDAYKTLMKWADKAHAAVDAKFQEQTLGKLADRIIGAESSGNANAKNPNSTATGLGQFIASTWLRLVKQYMPNIAAGRSNDEILELRKDAQLSRQMVIKYAEENAERLRVPMEVLGKQIDNAALYLAHFLGPGGALKVLSAKPGTPVENVLDPGAINANKRVLQGKTTDQVIAWAQKRMGISEQEVKIQQHLAKQEQERADRSKQFHERFANDLDVMRAQVSEGEKLSREETVRLAVVKALAKAKEHNETLSADEIEALKEATGALYDKKHAQDALNEAKRQERDLNSQITDLERLRGQLIQRAQLASQAGDLAAYDELRQQIDSVNTRYAAAIQSAVEFWKAVLSGQVENPAGSTDAAEAVLGSLELKLQNIQREANLARVAILGLTVGDIANALRNTLGGAMDSFIDKIAESGLQIKALGDAFRQFAADFLKEIAKMILKQAIFNALKQAGAAAGGWVGAVMTAVGTAASQHTGGVTGKSASRRRAVAAGWFTNAVRYHNGGIAGLAPNEVPTILKRGEEVLTESDPRHVANGGRAGGNIDLKVVNTIDAGSFVSEGLNTKAGGKAFMNFVRANQAAVKRQLGL